MSVLYSAGGGTQGYASQALCCMSHIHSSVWPFFITTSFLGLLTGKKFLESADKCLIVFLFCPLLLFLWTGDLESAPVLRAVGPDGCSYEFEWHTAAACVLSKTEGENCTVLDAQAGLCLKQCPFCLVCLRPTGSFH